MRPVSRAPHVWLGYVLRRARKALRQFDQSCPIHGQDWPGGIPRQDDHGNPTCVLCWRAYLVADAIAEINEYMDAEKVS